jgi:PhnB protein
MALQETFWSKYYGVVTDKFGIMWQLSYESGDI